MVGLRLGSGVLGGEYKMSSNLSRVLNFDPVPDLASTLLHLNLRRTVCQPWTRIEAAQFDNILYGEPYNVIQERV